MKRFLRMLYCFVSVFFPVLISKISTSYNLETMEKRFIPAGIYLFTVNNRNFKTMCEICSKLTIKTPERRHWRCSGTFIINFNHISHIVLVFLLLTVNK